MPPRARPLSTFVLQPGRRSRLPPAALLSLAAAACAVGCDRPPPAESLREWTAVDHHSADDSKLAAQPAAAARAKSAATDDSALVDLTWRNQCASCHGSAGRGDGQMGPMLHAPDLTDAQWQGRTSDAEIATVIKNGRNRMPRFDLPDGVVRGLVQRIRALRGQL